MNAGPLPMYVNEETGKAGPALGAEVVAALTPGSAPDLPGAAARANAQQVLGADARITQGEITETGWGVLWAADVTDAVKAQLQPLLALRRSQIPVPRTGPNAPADLYQEFTVPVGMTADAWIESFHKNGLTLTAPVQPWLGVPYYLLIVGSPVSISFEFQALLKMQWAVGRLYFDNAADYGAYAQAVVAYETAATIEQTRNAALWMTCHAGDAATTQLSTVLSQDFLNSPAGALGQYSNFSVESYVGAGAATQAQLQEIFRGNLTNGRPAVIFTGSHGLQCTYNAGDPTFPARQLARQGALITQDYNPATPGVPPTWVLTGADVPEDAKVDGTIIFLFACYSAGCPTNDGYKSQVDGTPVQIAAVEMIASLPQVLLSKGALAVIGHVDTAWAYSFGGLGGQAGQTQPQVIRNPLERLMQGRQAGWAADELTQSWTILSAASGEATPVGAGSVVAAPSLAATGMQPSNVPGQYAELIVARNDLRNYIVLGDPAVKLRVKELVSPAG